MNKERRLATIAALVFSALALLFLILPSQPLVSSAKAVVFFSVYPFISAGKSMSEITAGVPRNVAALLDTEAENRVLRERQKEAALISSQLESALEENKRLSAIVALTQSEKWKGVWASVIERDPSHWNSSFIVDKGSLDGVEPHDPVLGLQDGKAGLVGKIVEVSRENSKVLLVTAEMFSASCYVDGQNWDALVQGQGREMLRLNYLPADVSVEPGVKVFTSKSSVVFPQGILVGEIRKLHPAGSFQTFAAADLLPAVRPEAAKEVFIMKAQSRQRKTAKALEKSGGPGKPAASSKAEAAK